MSNTNQAPVSTDLLNQADAEGDAVWLDANASDADLDALTYSATGLPGGVTINATTGVISGTLSTTSACTHGVTITVSDGTDTDNGTFTWTVANTNQAPVLSTDLPRSAAEPPRLGRVAMSPSSRWRRIIPQP